ncbi:hypothetical protein ACIQF5_04665 [Streptomyces goshikiensis]|uniref:hypothetical protein n=1 Tax=Streptomyces goshikiensis TaxID=1942 RepID=UPI0038032DC9
MGRGDLTNGQWARILSQLQAEAENKGLITWDLNDNLAVCYEATVLFTAINEWL